MLVPFTLGTFLTRSDSHRKENNLDKIKISYSIQKRHMDASTITFFLFLYGGFRVASTTRWNSLFISVRVVGSTFR